MEGNGHALADIQSHVNARRKHLEDILPKSMSVERFTKIVLQSIAKTPRLMQCSPESLYIAMHSAAQLGLEPNGPLGHAFLVPYWSEKNKCYEAQFQAGWRGLVALADRTCGVQIWANLVRRGDKVKFVLGTKPDIEHESDFGNGDITHAYAVSATKDGRTQFEVMSVAEIHGIMRRTKSKDREGNIVGPWRDDFGEMARKTVVKRLCKYLPISPDMADAIQADDRADFEDIPEVESTPTKPQTRTEQVREQLKNATPPLPTAAEFVPDSQRDAANTQPQEAARRGKRKQEPQQSAPLPTADSKPMESQQSATTPTPATEKTSGGSLVPETTPAVAKPSTTSGQTPSVTTPATSKGTGEVTTEAKTFSSFLSIGMNRTKFIDAHQNAFYTESILVAEPLKKIVTEKKRAVVEWFTDANDRMIIIDAKVQPEE